MSSNLAIKLRTGTQKSHTAAENVGFMKCFLKGVVDRGCFAKFLVNLYYVYSQLEAEIEKHQDHAIVGSIYFPELNRQAALEKDMEFYYGKDWRSHVKISPAAQNYIARIQEVSATAPELLIGHAYTRYMGDLSGGQMLQKIAQSVLKLEGYQGTSFITLTKFLTKRLLKTSIVRH